MDAVPHQRSGTGGDLIAVFVPGEIAVEPILLEARPRADRIGQLAGETDRGACRRSSIVPCYAAWDPGSQTPVWEPGFAKLRFGNPGWPGSQTPVWEPGCETPSRETEFPSFAFPNGVWERGLPLGGGLLHSTMYPSAPQSKLAAFSRNAMEPEPQPPSRGREHARHRPGHPGRRHRPVLPVFHHPRHCRPRHRHRHPDSRRRPLALFRLGQIDVRQIAAEREARRLDEQEAAARKEPDAIQDISRTQAIHKK